MNLSKGAKAVYPGHGMVEIGEVDSEFLQLQPLDETSKILVPIAKLGATGLREIVTRDEALDVFRVVAERGLRLDRSPWCRRRKAYKEKLSGGALVEAAEVYRDLSALVGVKKLSDGERHMRRQALRLLVRELAAALGRTEERVSGELQAMVGGGK